MRATSPSLGWLIAAIIVPLLLLGFLTVTGARAQVKAAWATARDDAALSARFAAESLARDLSASLESAVVFPDPPVPDAAGDVPLDDSDDEALRAVRDDSSAGVSPAGLPLRVLAALKLWQSGQSDEDAAILLRLAMHDSPSILSPLILERLGASEELDEWRGGDRARAAFRRNADVDSAGKWFPDTDGVAWLAREGDMLRYLDVADLEKALGRTGELQPAWANVVLSVDGGSAANGRSDFEVMARAPVEFGRGAVVEILAARPAMIDAGARRQAGWTLGLLTLAVLVSAGALVMLLRVVEKEKRLGEMKSGFVASVSHELRAPVGSIRLMAEALHEGRVDDAVAKDFHRLIAGEGARLSHLVENVLDFTRIEQGRRDLRREETDMAGLVRDVMRLITPLADENGVLLEAGLEECTADVDPAAIRQAALNLLDNAIKFSPRGGTVRVKLAGGADGSWKLSISDDGPGIPEAEHQRIFERFHRVGNELRRETTGCGIGLAIVKSLIEAHGGRVEVKSSPGAGSEFSLIA